MLVLTRRVGERVVIGEGMVVHIIRITGGRVRVAIEAPAEVPIQRGEIQRGEIQRGELSSGAVRWDSPRAARAARQGGQRDARRDQHAAR